MKILTLATAARGGLLLAATLALTAATPSFAQTDDGAMAPMTPAMSSPKAMPAKHATRTKKMRAAKKSGAMAPMAGDSMERGDMTKPMSGARGRMPMPMSQGGGMSAGAPMPN